MATTKATPHDCPLKDFVIPPTSQDIEVSHQMDTRVGRLEGVVETLTHDIHEVSNNVNVVGKQVTELKDMFSDTITKLRDTFSTQLDTATSRLSQSTKPQWQTITAFVSIVVVMLGMAGAVVGLIMSGQADNIRNVKANTELISERLFNAQYEKGKADAINGMTSDHLKSLDITLQREMTLINETTKAEIKGLDEKLQLELNLVRQKIDADVSVNKEDVINMRTWRLKHAEEDSAAGAKVAAKQEMIEKRLDEMDKRQWDYRTDKLQAYETLDITKKKE